LKKADILTTNINPDSFEHNEERVLHKQYIDKSTSIKDLANKEKWDQAIDELISFANPLAAYFDKVMVMASDEKLRNNRIAMLSELRNLFTSVGNLSEII
jgi:glycyl-tRNA synthetase beta chain